MIGRDLGRARPRNEIRGPADPRQALAEIVAARGESLAALSDMIGHGRSYLHRFIVSGVPAALGERDHQLLLDYFGLGGRGLGIRDLWDQRARHR